MDIDEEAAAARVDSYRGRLELIRSNLLKIEQLLA
jgi:hypothetical protein